MKTNLMFTTAALLGATAIAWMGAGFIGANPLALLVTVVIAGVYALGLVELLQFRRATAGLRAGLAEVREADDFDLQPWLAKLPPALQSSVAQRVEGERVGLPAPVFTPYLVGLLVMLGLLGTFIGMVDTLQGAVTALQGSTELAAIRDGLAAPIQGLGLAFGTSVAGVAASAMLGLNGTLSRRERMLATRELDRNISGPLRRYSLHHNRQQTFLAMQQQADALPAVARQLGDMADKLGQLGERLGHDLAANQQLFHQQAQQQYGELADSVGRSLRDALADSGRLAGESISPAVDAAMQQVTASARETHEQLRSLAASSQQQRADDEADWLRVQGERMQALTAALREDLGKATGNVQAELGQLRADQAKRDLAVSERLQDIQRNSAQQLETLGADTARSLAEIRSGTAGQLGEIQQETAAQLAEIQSGTAGQLAQLQQDTAQQLSGLHAETGTALAQTQAQNREQLAQLADAVRQGITLMQEAAGEQLQRMHASMAEQLASLASELQVPMTELIATASETPRAAAEVIGKLREEVSNNIQRENALLGERQEILHSLTAVTGSLQESAQEQRAAVEQLVTEASVTLQGVREEFQQQLAAEAGRLSEISANAAGSTADIASLGESFSLAVQLFSESNAQLVENLCRIEESMHKSSERSDEQMSYYVAQAREIIDQSMLSQREIIEELRRLGQTGDLFADEAAS
ncbi:hypothetical protein F0M18_08875 [Pseudohalioglobus sediminis]|uniref:DUF802 domain-containing protein n=1 Tax=Pseudohalioglobus sediminis TaxID=2606449 RepID=A0A5B0X2I9_9GAMM|nr:hypothetical protein [Pseudohalioglobus sediminis]KAA1192757.1 hypothetical protein F0M18_08875 [Pseudohalioglobus sediminis]